MDGLPEHLKLQILGQVAGANVLASAEERLPVFDFATPVHPERLSLFGNTELECLDRVGYVVMDGFVGDVAVVEGIQKELKEKRKEMKQAGMKGSDEAYLNTAIRGDLHMWIQKDLKEAPNLEKLLGKLNDAKEELGAVYERPFASTQTQATCYPGEGSHYARHLDASKSKAQSRLLTFVWYANSAEGGQLR